MVLLLHCLCLLSGPLAKPDDDLVLKGTLQPPMPMVRSAKDTVSLSLVVEAKKTIRGIVLEHPAGGSGMSRNLLVGDNWIKDLSKELRELRAKNKKLIAGEITFYGAAEPSLEKELYAGFRQAGFTRITVEFRPFAEAAERGVRGLLLDVPDELPVKDYLLAIDIKAIESGPKKGAIKKIVLRKLPFIRDVDPFSVDPDHDFRLDTEPFKDLSVPGRKDSEVPGIGEPPPVTPKPAPPVKMPPSKPKEDRYWLWTSSDSDTFEKQLENLTAALKKHARDEKGGERSVRIEADGQLHYQCLAMIHKVCLNSGLKDTSFMAPPILGSVSADPKKGNVHVGLNEQGEVVNAGKGALKTPAEITAHLVLELHRLKRAEPDQEQRLVIIRAPSRVSYGHIWRILDAASTTGFTAFRIELLK